MLAAGVLALVWMGQSGGAVTLPVPVYTAARPGMFPAAWNQREISPIASSLEPEEVTRSFNIIDRAMEKYPDSLLKRNLKRVYVVRRLSFYGVPYGGTNSSDTIYLANAGREMGFSDRFLEESFHHEFSSILLRNYPSLFDRKAWLMANPPGFKYQGDGTMAVRSGSASTKANPRLQVDGFMAQYATASIEEDFNMIAEALLTGSSDFWRAVQSSPRLRQKADVAIRFYSSLSGSFNEGSFRALVEMQLSETARETRSRS
jgi:hypothetical protein